MKRRYAMAREGSAFIQDGFNLAWPQGGLRDVVELDESEQTERFKIRLATGSIAEVDLDVTRSRDIETPYELYEGESAKVIASKPADPVVIKRRRPDGSTRETVLKPLEKLETPRPPKTQITPVARTNRSRRRS